MWFISHSWEIEWCSLYMSLCFFLSIVVTNPYAMKTGFLFRTSWAPKVWNKVHLKWAKEGTEAKKSHPPEAFNLPPSSPAMPSPTEARCLEPWASPLAFFITSQAKQKESARSLYPLARPTTSHQPQANSQAYHTRTYHTLLFHTNRSYINSQFEGHTHAIGWSQEHATDSGCTNRYP